MEFGPDGNLDSRIGPAIARLEAAVFESDALANALHAVGNLLGFDHFCLLQHNFDHLRVIASEESQWTFDNYVAGGWNEADYRPSVLARTPPGRLCLEQDAIPLEARKETEVYHGLLVPNRATVFAGWRLAVEDEEWVYALTRSELDGELTKEEATGLQTFMPCANRALHLRRQIRDVRVQGMLDIADATMSAVLVLDHTGRVAAINPQAERVLEGVIGIRGGKLSSAHPASHTRLETLAQAARDNGKPGILANFVVQKPDGTVRLLVRPVAVREAGLDILPGARILVTIVEAKPSRVIAEDDLREVFGLSRAEASVAALLASGKDAQEVADARGVAIGTIRTQIRRLFEKLEVNRLGELIAVTSGFAGPSDDRPG